MSMSTAAAAADLPETSRRRASFDDFAGLPRQRLRALAAPHAEPDRARWGSHTADLTMAALRQAPPYLAAACPETVYAAHVGWFAVAPGIEDLPRRVKKGEILGAINCLGLEFNVTAPHDGTLVEICSSHDKAVEYGQALLRIAAA